MLGLGTLSIIIFKSPVEIDSAETLDSFEINTKVELDGKVERERVFEDFKVLVVEGIEIICDCEEYYLGKQIKIIGLIDEYNGKKQIKALTIEEVN